MSDLQHRIEEMQQLRETIRDRATIPVSATAFLSLLSKHINLLLEIDFLCNSITNGDTEGVQKFINRRVK